MRRIAKCTAALWLAGTMGLVAAAETYPARPIKLVEPYAARVEFGKSLSLSAPKFLKQKVFIENRHGEGGANAAAFVHAAPPDGYTLLLGRLASQIIRPAMVPATPYRWNEFTVLGVLDIDPLICAVHKDVPYASARELLDAIRKQPGALKYSTVGPATNTHLSVQYMLHLAGLKRDAAVAVHFESGLEAVQAVVSGKVQFACIAGGLIEPIKEGQLRGLFSTAPGRMSVLPQLPNASEAGLRDMGRIVGWTALLGPPRLPASIVARWKDALDKVSRDPEWIASTIRSGGLPAIRTMGDPDQFMRDQFLLYDELITTLDLAR
ncbi:tripartite tricarboxylate transporter substrate binding protein [Uliginosibacterium sp. H3]|uniref:Tripartite tricarboxylate transporter substrate binding protein n=1 Tax=Uliginosibacterium silvisoli TaxID=3114758 RepID=A0ABU6K095_9RHOO|nr:tripartite tricarboxylate transporter substrate binding protein [Uliginosibacterium sp. H3]